MLWRVTKSISSSGFVREIEYAYSICFATPEFSEGELGVDTLDLLVPKFLAGSEVDISELWEALAAFPNAQ